MTLTKILLQRRMTIMRRHLTQDQVLVELPMLHSILHMTIITITLTLLEVGVELQVDIDNGNNV